MEGREEAGSSFFEPVVVIEKEVLIIEAGSEGRVLGLLERESEGKSF